MSDTLQSTIARISIRELYGLYTYDIPKEGMLTKAAIIYGDNGVGKSTVLRLVFHLLSPASNSRHRTTLYQGIFSKLTVQLVNGTILTAERPEGTTDGPIELSISRYDEMLAYWAFSPKEINSDRARKHEFVEYSERELEGQELSYLGVLSEVVPTSFILHAERRLDGDDVSETSDYDYRRVSREPRTLNDLVRKSREIALEQAMDTARDWMQRKTFQGVSRGTLNVHGVYEDVLKRIDNNQPVSDSEVNAAGATALTERLRNISSGSADYDKYGLMSFLDTSNFVSAVHSNDPYKSRLVIELLEPYVNSQEARLNALQDVYYIVDKFINTINSFLRDKELSYKQGPGFSLINARGRPLHPSMLSSGEQQLLLLFFYVLVTRDKTTVFMIDEPEISLNVKWQRTLLTSLLELSSGTEIQFLFATHSLELLAKHRDKVVPLENSLSAVSS